VNRPDYVHFDLDPVKGAEFKDVLQTATRVHEALDALNLPNYPKTTGSRGIHIYVPIERGPLQKEVWTFAKRFAQSMERLYPDLITAEYKIAKRPEGHVLVDYNQNAWGRTLSSVYSVRPKPYAPVSTPVTWEEIRDGIQIEDFRLDNVRERLEQTGDLWLPVVEEDGRADLKKLI
jgi:bifunctional non-homologous end joining protein LigD